jgi:hypothetical protein
MQNFPVFSVSSADLSHIPGLPETVIAKAKKGDETAFAEVYNCYFKRSINSYTTASGIKK